MSKNENENKKKRNILIIVGVVLLIAILIFLWWFFNRKFNVTFDFNNGDENVTIQVKYKKLIDEKDIKTEKELGESFIAWYEVIGEKDGEDVLDDKEFDFKTSITKDYKLKATYKAKEVKEPDPEPTPAPEVKKEYITIKFNSNGGSKVSDKKIEKGGKLSFPKNPSKSGYKFVSWTYKNGNTVKNNSKFKENTTLYAKWEKLEESISLSLSRSIIHRNGYKTTTAKANVKNSQGNVTYSLEGVKNNCVSINSKTGAISASGNSSCGSDQSIIVKATSKTGKTATAKLTLENDLSLSYGSHWYNKNDRISDITASQYSITANQTVSWTAACGGYDSKCKYVGKKTTSPAAFYGNFEIKPNPSDKESMKSAVKITAKTKGGQSISLVLTPKVN